MALEIPGIGNPSNLSDFAKLDPAKQAPHVPRQVVGGHPADSTEQARRDANYEKLLEQLFNTVAPYDQKLRFSINRQLGEVVVKVIDTKTDKVIREIPPEEIQKLQAKINEAVGLLINKLI